MGALARYWTDKDVERFASYIDVLPCGCWFWGGARSRGSGNKKWYGSFRVAGRTVRAHRFVCDIAGIDCPPGHDRDHTCVFSLCVNPGHIEVVTKTENDRQRRVRGLLRSASPAQLLLGLQRKVLDVKCVEETEAS